MAILGTNTTPTAGFKFVGSALAAASQFTMPSGGGVVTSLSGYFDSESNGSTGYLCVWDSSGNLLIASSGFGVNNKSGSGAGGQEWWTASVTATYLAAGTYWVGFMSTNSLVYSSEVGGSSNTKAMSSPGSFAGSSGSGIGTVGAYATYTPGGVGQVWNGTSWTDGVVISVWNGSAWVQANPQVWNGSAWQTTT